jgi:hypothetical protein
MNLPAFGEIFFNIDEDDQITKITKMRLLDILIMSFSLFKLFYSFGMVFYFRSFIQLNKNIRNSLSILSPDKLEDKDKELYF